MPQNPPDPVKMSDPLAIAVARVEFDRHVRGIECQPAFHRSDQFVSSFSRDR
jgi:hypothetical protein